MADHISRALQRAMQNIGDPGDRAVDAFDDTIRASREAARKGSKVIMAKLATYYNMQGYEDRYIFAQKWIEDNISPEHYGHVFNVIIAEFSFPPTVAELKRLFRGESEPYIPSPYKRPEYLALSDGTTEDEYRRQRREMWNAVMRENGHVHLMKNTED